MPTIAGLLRTEDTRRVADVPAGDLAGVINDTLAQFEIERDRALAHFVAATTTLAEEHVPLTGIDEGQDVDRYGRALEMAVIGGYDVAYPWVRRGWAHGWDYEAERILTLADVDRTVTAQARGNAKWHLRSIFKALFNNTSWTHIDNEIVSGGAGVSRTIQPLANGDAVSYPDASITAMDASESTANHYVYTGYAAADISDSNNPLADIRDKLRKRFVTGTIVAHINSAQAGKIRGLTNFVDAATNPAIQQPPTVSTAVQPGETIPGDYIGVDGDTNVHVYIWDAVIPATYMVGTVIGRAPLKKRIPSVPGLQGFKLEAEEDHYPLYRREFRDRAGYGGYDRLAGVVVQVATGGSYAVPSIYTR